MQDRPRTNIQSVIFPIRVHENYRRKMLKYLGLAPIKPAHITESLARYRISNPKPGEKYRINKISKDVWFVTEGEQREPLIEAKDNVHKYIGIANDAGKIRKVPFGALAYEHYKDRGLGIHSAKDHKDEDRRKEYQARHGAIKIG